MAENKRKSGLELIGDVPWGTHFCQFYLTKDDLTDILVPYFRAGLESNELCMWITSAPLTVQDARAAMQRAVPDFARHVDEGRIEILPYSEWYLRDGVFDSDRVLQSWIDKLDEARARGLAGLRLSGNTFWLEQRHWKEFTAYEEAIDSTIGDYPMIALCTYSLEKCGASEIMDVVANHRFALVKRDGRWETVMSSEGKRAEQALRESERRYRSLFESMTEGFALHEIVCDEAGAPRDYRFIDVNPAFERLTGLRRADVVGRTIRDIMPAIEPEWIETYGRVALAGEPVRFERRAAALDREYEVFAYSPAPRQFAALFVDITSRKKLDREIERVARFPRLNPNPVLEMDTAGTIYYANPSSFLRFPGLRETGPCPPSLAPIVASAKRLDASGGNSLVDEHGFDGSWYQVVYVPVREDGHIRVYMVDITERKRAEEALSDREQLLRQTGELLETVTRETQMIIATVDADLRYTHFNSAYRDEMQRLTGRELRIGMTIAEAFERMPEQRDTALERWRRTLAGESSNYSIEFGDPERYRRVYEVRQTPLRDAHGSVVGAGEVAYDVTERVRAEEERRAGEMRLARSQEIAHLGSWELDIASGEIAWSDEVYRIFGLRPQERRITYADFLAMIHPDDRETVHTAYNDSLRGENLSYEIEHRIVRDTTGEIRIVHEKCDHLRDPSGRIVRSLGIVHDITERTAAEEKIRRQNAVLEGINRIFREALAAGTEEELGRICLAVAESVTGSAFGFLGEINSRTGLIDDIAISDPGWKACRTIEPAGHGKRRPPAGFRIQGIYGRVVIDGVGFFTNDPAAHPDRVGTPEGHPALRAFLGVPLVQGGSTIGILALGNRPGGYRTADLEAAQALAGPIVQVLMRRRIESALRESENLFRSLANSAPLIIMRFDRDLRMRYMSPRGRELTGTDPDTFIGKTALESGFPEPLARRMMDAIEAVFRTGLTAEIEIDVPTAPGLKTFISRYAPETDEQGVVEGVLAVATDITSLREAAAVLERDREELKRLVDEKTSELLASRVEMEKAKRLSDIGTLSAIVAHELRNPLGAMNLAVFNLRRKTNDSALYGHFNTIEKKIAESNQIINNLLYYARLRPPSYRSFELGELIEEAVETVENQAGGKSVTLSRNLAAIENLSIEADPLQIKELVVNLVDNAFDAVGDEGGVVEIGARRSNGSVVVTVADNGKGISEEQMARVWEPFYSTKSKGTGLGLSVCRQIATLHDGNIDIQSAPGKGTLVTLTLPVRKTALGA